MKTPDLENQVKSVLMRDVRLKEMWAKAPSAEYIPFRGKRGSFYLLISLCLNVNSSHFDELAYACLSTLRLIASSQLLAGYSGIEIVPYLIEGGKAQRVCRLSVEIAALDVALKMTSADILREKPAEGITCGWYFEKPMKQ